MHEKLDPVLLLTVLTIAAAVCFHPSVAQQPTVVSGYGRAIQAMPYGPTGPLPFGQSDYDLVSPLPNRPAPTSRPEAWPGTRAPVYRGDWSQPNPPAQQPGPNTAKMELLEGPRILARVGSEVILAGEVTPEINEIIKRNKGIIPDHELLAQREILIRQKLKQHIERKLIYHDARQTIPEENLPRIEKSLGKQFDEVELPEMIKRAKVQTRQELDLKLLQLGTSLDRVRKAFIEQTLARSWIRQQVKYEEEVTFDQMLEYYRDHAAEFEKPARARWQELMARFSKYPTKYQAGAAIAEMGNQAAAGVPFEQVAKARSDGSTASEGGARDWTTKGNLVCEVLDRALFRLPVGQLSPILESQNGFHIVIVTEREEAHRTPFLEAQVEIEKKIKEERTREQFRAYVLGLKEKIPVWTVFDEKGAP